MKEGGWATVVIAGLGFGGTVAAGAIGYQAGTAAVNKDYVQIAVANLDRKDASPELRKWSVDVLNRLSPVPFGKKLEGELSDRGLGTKVYIQPQIPVPAFAKVGCPDFFSSAAAKSADPLPALARAYADCSTKANSMVKYLAAIHKMTTDGQSPVPKPAGK